MIVDYIENDNFAFRILKKKTDNPKSIQNKLIDTSHSKSGLHPLFNGHPLVRGLYQGYHRMSVILTSMVQ